MPSFKSIFGLLEKLESPDITVHQTRCAAVRNRNAQCMRCAEVCTSGCISYDDNELVVSPEKCIGCGTCATACPTCALEAHNPGDAELAAACSAAMGANEGVAVIACERFSRAAHGCFDEAKVVTVTCLGRVEESLVVGLAEEGARKVMLVRGACETCPHATGWHMAELVCETANTLLEVWNSPCRAQVAQKLPGSVRLGEKSFDAGRRAFFTDVRAVSKTAAVAAGEMALEDLGGSAETGAQPAQPERYLKVMDDGTLPHFIPDRRERLLNSLAALGEPSDVMIETRLWGHVVIDTDRCSSCQMCATFCPTGAISKFEEADGTFGIDHFPGSCVKCRCCTDICPTGALVLSDEVFAVDLLTGAAERVAMRPRRYTDGPHQMFSRMKDLLGTDQVYER